MSRLRCGPAWPPSTKDARHSPRPSAAASTMYGWCGRTLCRPVFLTARLATNSGISNRIAPPHTHQEARQCAGFHFSGETDVSVCTHPADPEIADTSFCKALRWRVFDPAEALSIAATHRRRAAEARLRHGQLGGSGRSSRSDGSYLRVPRRHPARPAGICLRLLTPQDLGSAMRANAHAAEPSTCREMPVIASTAGHHNGHTCNRSRSGHRTAKSCL